MDIEKKKQCFYEVLELKKDCNQDEIKAAYKKFALKYHPDKNRQNPEEAKKKFQEISEAYTVLSDENKRATYDKYGTIDEDEIGFDYDSFMEQFDVGDFGHFMSMMMGGGDGFFKQFDMFTHSTNRRGKYQKKRRGNDPFAQMFNIKFANEPKPKKEKPKDQAEEEWETDSEDEENKKSKKDQEWETDSDEDEDEDGIEDEDADKAKDTKGSKKSKQGFQLGDFMAFEGMSPFSMMGMHFGEQEEDPETEAFMEFLTKNVQYMKNNKIKCKLCNEIVKEDDVPEHIEDEHEEEFEEFKKSYETKQKNQKNKKR